MRVGMGYDVHKLVKDRKLFMGGVEIPYELGLLGHSDADVLLHAIMDALLGAAALGDIGKHFPDTDDRYKGISSIKLLEEVGKKIDEANYIIKNIADALKIDVDRVNVKATTEEGLGFTGSGEGISSQAICSLNSISNYIYGAADMTNCRSDCGGCMGCQNK